jgi:hypothetical protein
MMLVIPTLICISALETEKVVLVQVEHEHLSKHTSDTQMLHWRCATRYEGFP